MCFCYSACILNKEIAAYGRHAGDEKEAVNQLFLLVFIFASKQKRVTILNKTKNETLLETTDRECERKKRVCAIFYIISSRFFSLLGINYSDYRKS